MPTMANSPDFKSFGASDEALARYAAETFQPEDRLLADIRRRAEAAGLPPIHVGAMDGLHLEVLTRAFGARRVVEIGTLAGYSGVCLARAMPADGRLHTFEFESRHAEVAAETFRAAGVMEKVRIHVGPAIENLRAIEGEGPFDLVFIDADKVSYPDYLRWAGKNLRVGGAVLADNTFAWGMIAQPAGSIEDAEDRAAAEALRAFNREVAAPGGPWRATILPTGEGLTLAVRVK